MDTRTSIEEILEATEPATGARRTRIDRGHYDGPTSMERLQAHHDRMDKLACVHTRLPEQIMLDAALVAERLQHEGGDDVGGLAQRGYGRTTRPTQVADYALAHLVDDVVALINVASAKNVLLIGHDWGAMVAWCFAARQRRPLDRLVIMNDPHPLCFRAALKHWRQIRKSWYVAFFPAAKIAGTDADNEWRRHSAPDVRWCGAATGRAGRLH